MRYPDPNEDREIVGIESQIQRYKKWVLWAAFLSLVVWINLYLFSKLSAEQVGTLGALGDFFGGMLNPFFAFMAFVLLTQSIRLQLKEMSETRKALQETSAETRRAAEAQEKVAIAQEAAAKAQEKAALALEKTVEIQIELSGLQRNSFLIQERNVKLQIDSQNRKNFMDFFDYRFNLMCSLRDNFVFFKNGVMLRGAPAIIEASVLVVSRCDFLDKKVDAQEAYDLISKVFYEVGGNLNNQFLAYFVQMVHILFSAYKCEFLCEEEKNYIYNLIFSFLSPSEKFMVFCWYANSTSTKYILRETGFFDMISGVDNKNVPVFSFMNNHKNLFN